MASRVVSSVVCCDIVGGHFTLMISNNNEVHVFGMSTLGAHGFEEKEVTPRVIPLLINIHSVCSFGIFTVFLDNNGNVFTIGGNFQGELGIGKNKKSLPYTNQLQRVTLPPIQQISCGVSFGICVSYEGDLYSFGSNYSGQLGHGHLKNLKKPKQIKCIRNVDFVECGGNHVICKTLKDEIFVWGSNIYGQLGIGTTKIPKKPLKCNNWPDDIMDIKCGENFTYVLASSQEVYACGDNECGQLGIQFGRYYCELQKITELSNIIRIETGPNHGLCIDSYKKLHIVSNNIFNSASNGEIYVNEIRQHLEPLEVVDISKGGVHCFVKTTSNEIFTFGKNNYLQLSTKTIVDNQREPIRVFEDNENIWRSNSSIVKSARK